MINSFRRHFGSKLSLRIPPWTARRDQMVTARTLESLPQLRTDYINAGRAADAAPPSTGRP